MRLLEYYYLCARIPKFNQQIHYRMHRLYQCLLAAASIIGTFILSAVTALVVAWPLMLLWNWLMPVIFHLLELTYWQAVGIEILAVLLFRTTPELSFKAKQQ